MTSAFFFPLDTSLKFISRLPVGYSLHEPTGNLPAGSVFYFLHNLNFRRAILIGLAINCIIARSPDMSS
jgi:hypothetical protein